MANITITGLGDAISDLDYFSLQQLPAALAMTLTDIANIAKDNAYEEMSRVFKSPTPFTLNSLKIERATKNKLEAKLLLKDPSRHDDPHHYLNVELNGGERGFKPFEARLFFKGKIPEGQRLVPASGATLDGYGNMSRGQITQILAYFDTFNEDSSLNPSKKGRGFNANMGDKGRDRLKKGTKKRYGFGYFVVNPGAGGHLGPGIYKRTNMSSGKLVGPAAPIRPVMVFSDVAEYSPRINLQRILDDTYAADAGSLFERNIENALRTAKWATG